MKHYALKLKDGLLIGIDGPGIPCRECVGLWLNDRKISFEPYELPATHPTCEPGLFYELTDAGQTSLEAYLERHPNCSCDGISLSYPKARRLNFAFSRFHSIKAARFATPNGNLWLAQSQTSDGRITRAVSDDREVARLRATIRPDTFQGVAQTVVAKYSRECKQPMLVVGSNNWIRQHVPFFLLQQYDVHLFFYPNNTQAWVCGAIGLNRLSDKAEPIKTFAAHTDVTQALKQALYNLVPAPTDFDLTDAKANEVNPKLNVWLQNWIYRCPKMSLKDALGLKAYEGYPVPEVEELETVYPIFRKVIGGKV